MTPFETLQEKFPVFQIKNKRNYAQKIPVILADGAHEEIEVPPFSVVKVPSKEMLRFPDLTALTMQVPSMKDMIAAGAFEKVNTATEPVIALAGTDETDATTDETPPADADDSSANSDTPRRRGRTN